MVLGSILFLYLVFPLLLWLCRRGRAARWGGFAAACALGVAVHLAGWDARLVAIHLPEFFFGMLFVSLARARPGGGARRLRWPGWRRCGGGLGGGAADSKILCALFSAAVFAALALVSPLLRRGPFERLCALLGKYSYAVFLCHHVLIQRLVRGFDLSLLTRRGTRCCCFFAYLVATAAVLGVFVLAGRQGARRGRGALARRAALKDFAPPPPAGAAFAAFFWRGLCTKPGR